MAQGAAIELGSAQQQPDDIRQCRPGDAGAIAALAFRSVWRRRNDGPALDRVVRLVFAPATMLLFALETHDLWINAARTAVVSVRPWRHRNRTTAMLVVTVLVPTAILAMAGFALSADDEMLLICLLVICLLVMAVLFPQCWRHRAIPELVAARRRLELPGHDVVEAANFLAAAPGTGMALARRLCALADEHGTTIVAEARGPARQRLYRRLGFEPVAQARGAALLVRRPVSRP
jgi:hypothetical protein